MSTAQAKQGSGGKEEAGDKGKEGRTVYTLGVFPGSEGSSFLSSELLSRYLPVGQYLSQHTGAEIRVVPISVPSLALTSLKQGGYALFFGPAAFGAFAMDKGQYVPVARDDKESRAVFVVPNASPIKTLADIKSNDLIATPPPNLLLTVLTKQTLVERGLSATQAAPLSINQGALLTAINVGTHKATVLRKRAATKLLEQEPGKYRVIGESVGVPSFTLVAAPQVPAEFRAKLLAALMRLQQSSRTAAGEAAAWQAFDVTKFVSAMPDDYTKLISMMNHWQPAENKNDAKAGAGEPHGR